MSDPRESPEFREYERLREEFEHAAYCEGEAPNRRHERLTNESCAALDAFVLRLLAERPEALKLRRTTLRDLRGIARIPTTGPAVVIGITPPEARAILALHPAGEP